MLNGFGEHQDANDSYITPDIKQNQCGKLITGLLDTLCYIVLSPLIPSYCVEPALAEECEFYLIEDFWHLDVKDKE